MEVITNSRAREAIRLKQQNVASQKISSVEREAFRKKDEKCRNCDREVRKIQSFDDYVWIVCVIAGVFGFAFGIMLSFVTSIILALGAGFGTKFAIESFQKTKIEEKRNRCNKEVAEIEKELRQERNAIQREADRITRNEIKKYDKRVAEIFDKIYQNQNSIQSMVVFARKQFEQAVSECAVVVRDIEQFVCFDFNMNVTNKSITFSYKPKGQHITQMQRGLPEFSFLMQHFHDLHDSEECEALAAVITSMLNEKIKVLYKNNHAVVRVSHNDASVTLNFQMINSRFIPNKPIY